MNRKQQNCPICYRQVIGIINGDKLENNHYISDPSVICPSAPDKTCERCSQIEKYTIKRVLKFSRGKTILQEVEKHRFNYKNVKCILICETNSYQKNKQTNGTWNGVCIAPKNIIDIDNINPFYYMDFGITKNNYIFSNDYDTLNDSDPFINDNDRRLTNTDKSYKSKEYTLKKILDLVDNITIKIN